MKNFKKNIDKISYYTAKFIKKIEKKFSITLFYFFPFRLITRLIEILSFNKLNEDFVKVANYYLPKKILEKNKTKVLISGGLGFDVDFEHELLEKYKTQKLICLDPIELRDNIKKKLDNNKVSLFQRPLFNRSKKVKLFLPYEKNTNPNLSIDGVYTNNDKFIFSRAIDIMTVIKYSKIENFDYKILKLDIEGVADKVIHKILDNNIFFNTICFELERPTSLFSQLNFFIRLFALIRKLSKHYKLYYYTKLKLGFRLEIIAVNKNNS